MKLVNTTFAVALVAVSLVSCKAKNALDEAVVSANLAKSGTIDLMKQTADDEYNAPADGKLTPQQVELYLKVRERERIIARVAKKELKEHGEKSKEAGEKSLSGFMEGMKGLGSVGDLLTADIRAAKELGYNTQEYLWIKEQVLAASGLEMADKMQQATAAMLEQSYQEMKKGLETASDPATKKMYEEMLAGFEKNKAEMAASKEQEDPATAYNRQLLSKYENALNAIATELEKFEDNDGDAQRAISQMQGAATQATSGK